MAINRIEAVGDGHEFGNVTLNGRLLNSRPFWRSLKLRRHSPCGFAWGYSGSGPAQLALAILLEAGVSDDVALDVYQQFKRDFIAVQPQRDSWALELDIQEWAKQTKEAAHV